MPNLSLNSILDEEFLSTLAKSADLYKIGSNTILDPEEIRIGLKVVPRAVMSMLISELSPMEINSHKDIQLPFGKVAYLAVNKNAADDYTGSLYSDNKLIYSFRNRSIPGLGIILLSSFELYDLEELSGQKSGHNVQIAEDADKKVQKLIDERMELHSLVGRVVEDKMAQREAIHKLMMNKLDHMLKDFAESKIATKPVAIPTIATNPPSIATNNVPISKPLEVSPSDMAKSSLFPQKGVHQSLAQMAAPGSKNSKNKELQGMSSMGYNVRNPRPGMVDPKTNASANLEEQRQMPKPNLPKSEEISKKEKGSPLKGFLDRKKKAPKQYHVEMAKSETVDCDSCGKTIFGSGEFSGCLCFGQDQNRKIWIKKNEDGIQLKFSRGWDSDNIALLLETLRRSNGRN